VSRPLRQNLPAAGGVSVCGMPTRRKWLPGLLIWLSAPGDPPNASRAKEPALPENRRTRYNVRTYRFLVFL